MKQFLSIISIMLLLLSGVWAQNVGDPATDFTHSTTDEESITMSDYKGKVIYLFFFGYN